MLSVSEIFTSIQGETSFAGRTCAFVRLAGCNLNCRWCDTTYARAGGEPWEVELILRRLARGPRLVAVTGGEPLCQDETPELVARLLDAEHTVLVETNGSLPIDLLDVRAHRIVDLKSPSSGEVDKIFWPNLDLVTPRDELKIVIADWNDYVWAKELMAKDQRVARSTVNMGPAHGLVGGRELADWILADQLEVRFNLQLHRILWPNEQRGR